VERVPWLKRHPEVGVIAASRSEETYLRGVLGATTSGSSRSITATMSGAARRGNPSRWRGDRGGAGPSAATVKALRRTLAGLGVACPLVAGATGAAWTLAEFYASWDVASRVARRGPRPWKGPAQTRSRHGLSLYRPSPTRDGLSRSRSYYWPAARPFMADVADAGGRVAPGL